MTFEQASTQADQTNSGSRALRALGSLRLHWPEYLMEVGELVLYIPAACYAPAGFDTQPPHFSN